MMPISARVEGCATEKWLEETASRPMQRPKESVQELRHDQPSEPALFAGAAHEGAPRRRSSMTLLTAETRETQDMERIEIDTDYLVVGSGAVGMAFTDTLVAETSSRIVIVDQHHKPGGHWNDAYPFVTLHQPSAFYGVSSRELSRGRVDEGGLNAGLNELATGAEISAYFDDVMRNQFLPTGRVQYFPMCKYLGNGEFVSIASGQRYLVRVAAKTVDATYFKTSVPSTHTPNFEIASGVAFVPLNELPKITQAPEGYVVVGGGKTGIDACLWLLEHGVDPGMIRWIMPRDAWLFDRLNTQPTDPYFDTTIGALAKQMEAIAAADSIDDLFTRLEAAGVLVRIDQSVRPRMFHGATISQPELVQLRRIENVIRLGRITSLDSDRIVLEGGTIPTSPGHLHIDCSARAIGNLESRPIFEGDTITIQTVRSIQPVFSAALIAHVEATRRDEAEKNDLCEVAPLPNHDTDWIRLTAASMRNQFRWSQEEDLRAWLFENRLDGMSRLIRSASRDDMEKQALLARLRHATMPAMANLQEFVSQLAEP